MIVGTRGSGLGVADDVAPEEGAKLAVDPPPQAVTSIAEATMPKSAGNAPFPFIRVIVPCDESPKQFSSKEAASVRTGGRWTHLRIPRRNALGRSVAGAWLPRRALRAANCRPT